MSNKPKLISVYKKSGVELRKPISYVMKASAIDYTKFSTQRIINGTPPGNLPNPQVEPVGNFIVAENINMLLTENNNNLVIE